MVPAASIIIKRHVIYFLVQTWKYNCNKFNNQYVCSSVFSWSAPLMDCPVTSLPPSLQRLSLHS